jgi:hypothetical protein
VCRACSTARRCKSSTRMSKEKADVFSGNRPTRGKVSPL